MKMHRKTNNISNRPRTNDTYLFTEHKLGYIFGWDPMTIISRQTINFKIVISFLIQSS